MGNGAGRLSAMATDNRQKGAALSGCLVSLLLAMQQTERKIKAVTREQSRETGSASGAQPGGLKHQLMPAPGALMGDVWKTWMSFKGFCRLSVYPRWCAGSLVLQL